jgi:Calcineurin-like phosphoesterase
MRACLCRALLVSSVWGCNPSASAGSEAAKAEQPSPPANAPSAAAARAASPTVSSPTVSPPTVSPRAVSSPAAAAPAAEKDFHYPAPARLIAIGDLHGDLAAARAALKLGGAIDTDDHWAGGTLTVVQTGDQIDRADEDRDVLDLFDRLTQEARAAGGRVVALNGNHEIMNVQGDYRYVTPGAVEPFAGVSPRSPLARDTASPFAARAAAFLPGGAYALQLAKRDVIAMVGDSVFVHGGVLPEHVSYGIGRINAETRAWMQSGAAAAPAIVASDRGPDWVRDFSVDPVSEQTCALLGRALDALAARRMVVGHTPQKSGVTSACKNRVYRIDVGLSRFYGGPIQILQITPRGVEVLKAVR